ncbi:hypothetical protein HPO96_13650 [Kribbella sandramycini]|uniref:Uncharacterized protein n=1 Tax=Kribbella sandramycini TaxID=60450 RepID=A0A7Y4L0G4_9ACTN|nr:hypothetical protein [Kribbella sandramycini]MBB6565020.1 hypothetical protein [Kribbella sandramycini]NOL41292.1 hypothetical protein [Kribbella sandramycini]
MTAQHHDDQHSPPTEACPDPLGPITLPKRSKIGARAFALVGSLGMTAFAVAAVANDHCSTWPTIES